MKTRNSRQFFVENNARIEELMKSGYSIKSTYYTLIDEGKCPGCLLESFRKAMKRHRPDLHKMIAYGNQHTLSPAKPAEKERVSTAAKLNIQPPETKRWKHNKVPDESLFRKAEEE